MSVESPPTGSQEYRDARAELLAAEIELKEQRERVAEMRRGLPDGPAVVDYVFQAGAEDLDDNSPDSFHEVRLSELFEPGHEHLVLIQFMYGGAQSNPCPMCSMWADGYNAVARHVRQKASFALVAEAELSQLRSWAAKRRWSDIRLLSSAGTSFKTDFGMADADGNQFPGVSVFTRSGDGSPRHFYSGSAMMADGHWRGVDLLSPVWNLFDLLPSGRGDWFPGLEYD